MTSRDQSEKNGHRIMVAVGAVILDDTGRILLVKHVEAKKGGYWYGKWICPGGKLKYGESIEDGTKREILEETGLEIDLVGRAIVFDRIVKPLGETQLHVIYIDHKARVTGGRLKAGSDVGVAEWFSIDRMKQHWGELHEDTRRLLIGLEIVEEDVNTVVA